MTTQKKRILIFVVAYKAEKTIQHVLARIPRELCSRADIDLEVLVIDDCSSDRTFSEAVHTSRYYDIPVKVLVNPANLGYGGNQKLGYHYAITQGFDAVALLHGDGQYAPEYLPELLDPILSGQSDVVFGSRMLKRGDALRGRMPLYKFVGNIVLTNIQNFLTGGKLSEWHSGYRIYSCKALRNIPFDRNSNGFEFDTEIIIQLMLARARIRELPIPTYYGDEISHVNGISYALKIVWACMQSRLQKYGVLYDRKFDLAAEVAEQYQPKFHFPSSHSMALAAVTPGDKILILGAGSVELVRPFVDKGCSVVAIELGDVRELQRICVKAIQGDLDELDLEGELSGLSFDRVLALDVIEHLKSPEALLERLRALPGCAQSEFIFTVPNIAFIIMRLMLLLGFFNYGKRGILDRTHTRLFTFSSMKHLCVQSNFRVVEMKGIPAPFPLALKDGSILARALVIVNQLAISVWRALFAFQIMCRATVSPRVEDLLEATERHSEGVQVW